MSETRFVVVDPMDEDHKIVVDRINGNQITIGTHCDCEDYGNCYHPIFFLSVEAAALMRKAIEEALAPWVEKPKPPKKTADMFPTGTLVRLTRGESKGVALTVVEHPFRQSLPNHLFFENDDKSWGCFYLIEDMESV